MEEHASWITLGVNHLLGGAATKLYDLLHIHPENPALPIPQHVATGFVVLVLLTLIALILRARLSVEKPGALQQMAEGLLTNSQSFGIKDLLVENTGRDGVGHIPFVGAISVFILFSNLLGAFPSTLVTAPTGNVTVPLACAILTFLYFNWSGFTHHGMGEYLLTFAGSPHSIGDWVLAILLFPVELISTCARVLSLTVRLWANMYASDLIYVIFLGLLTSATTAAWSKSVAAGAFVGIFAACVPVLFIGLHIFVSIIQAYVFTVLPSVYLGMATSEEH
ncbi:MAG: F0F1 ATP synthase subunit A [Acidobacteria bacterium]|nr:F0F1 ATP synthase subunit A [Acidobacteriota bacterium]MBS1867586.1 F0F1 ATP synthase subunit A [Acidobacteriota bacterium]